MEFVKLQKLQQDTDVERINKDGQLVIMVGMSPRLWWILACLPSGDTPGSACYTTKSDTVMKTNPSQVFWVILSIG
jgi:hypothetical protein